MHLKMKNRDYIPDRLGGFRTASGDELLLQQVLFLLTARRGKFLPLPEVGSRLYTLVNEKPSAWNSLARAYAQEALQGLGLTVTDASVVRVGDRLEVSVEISQNDNRGIVKAVVL